MGTFIWDQSLSLQVAEMDDEHKTLINLMNHLEDQWKANASTSELAESVGKLASFTVKHFQDEETYMDRIGFPGLSVHKAIHVSLLSQLDGYATEFKQKGKLEEKFFLFLHLWLKAHIRGIDMKYSEFSHHGSIKKTS